MRGNTTTGHWVALRQILILTGLLAFSLTVQAQNALTPTVPVNGAISPGSAQNWRFSAQTGQVLSFVVAATAPDFDPMLTLIDGEGRVLIANDDAAYPESTDAILEAYTIPRTGTYTLRVSGYAGGGSYRLTMFPGYSQINLSENFNGEADWTPSRRQVAANVGEGRYQLQLEGIGQEGAVLLPEALDAEIAYAHVDVTSVSGRNGWRVGLAWGQEQGQERAYVAVMVNAQGSWRVIEVRGENVSVIRDWASHPSIAPGTAAFSLGALIMPERLEFYYNDAYVGSTREVSLRATAQPGLAVGTAEAFDSQTSAQFDDFTLTTPRRLAGETIFPRQVTIRRGDNMVEALRRRLLLPTGGDMMLTLPESTGRFVNTGVTRFPLASGTRFARFVLGADVTWQSSNQALNGCGLTLRGVNDEDYTLAFVDNQGGYGLSQRTASGFETHLFNESDAFSGNRHHLMVVALDDTVHLYVNGSYVGQARNAPRPGEIGYAVVNYDLVDTTCTFKDVWLWRWE